MKKYHEYKTLNLPQISNEVLEFWEENKIFEKSVSSRDEQKPFVFYEGPPSANGLPGIHHVMARAIKDIFCRYKTLKGFQVKRKAGWDTHGLPVELGVEKALGITKEDIGTKITVEEYNNACRKDVMKYTDIWNDLTKKMGYWVDMEHPYITYDNRYIESVWWLLNKLYAKGSIYKGYTIQPYSPAAGTGLSSHELNQPGCYRDVKDRSATVMFKITKGLKLEGDVYFLAWTTTPWTLPSNTALAVGKNIDYVIIKTYNQFTHKPITVVLAKELHRKYFVFAAAEGMLHLTDDNENLVGCGVDSQMELLPFNPDLKTSAFWKTIGICKGSDLEGIRYEQLLPFTQPTDGDAFRVIIGDFVTTEDGTGIVHIAPSFGADDFRVAKQNGIGSLTLVDKRGKFLPEVKDGVFLYGGEYVKEAYLTDAEKEAEFQHQKKVLEVAGKIKELKSYLSVDERIVLKLQEEGKLFKKETYEHSYPHCWRTDKPVLYYPLDSWFIKTTDYKERMIELNKTINWKPESTGTGRFGNWLENLNDWNLSRSRFWGIPIPIWRDRSGYELCVGSKNDLKEANAINPLNFNKKRAKGYYNSPTGRLEITDEFLKTFDFHKPYIDDVIFIVQGQNDVDGEYDIILKRESDLIDVWFDSGAMPFAQMHFPFENVKEFANNYPADFIAEGVDQTRGWFFTLHAISVMLKDEIQEELEKHGIEVSDEKYPGVAYRNVVSNGLVLDKNGNKMSKRLGNAADPFETLQKYGPDATRWYMITNAQPWDNLKFDSEGIAEVQRKFFGTLYNTYSFFSLYANIDGFAYIEQEIPIEKRPEIDRWILSELNSLVKTVEAFYETYEPTHAGRLIEEFVDINLSNWYVRLCRRRFWKGEYSEDKIAAYQTLYTCLEVITQLASPIAPFFMDRLFCDLNTITKRHKVESVHLTDFPEWSETQIDARLQERMKYAQKITSLVLSIRKKESIRVRQPLSKIRIPVINTSVKEMIEDVKDLILAEVNVKELEFITEADERFVKMLKLNFKTLGKKCGKYMKTVQTYANNYPESIIEGIEKHGGFEILVDAENKATIVLEKEDVEIIPVDIPGWKVASDSGITVALDITITALLKEEGIARELVNRIQNLRKDNDFEVTDKILLRIQENSAINTAINNNLNYICSETLASSLELVNDIKPGEGTLVEVNDEIKTLITINKLN